MSHGSEEQRQVIRRAIESGGLESLDAIRDAIESSGGLEYTARLARREADAAADALRALPESPYRDALAALAQIAAERNS